MGQESFSTLLTAIMAALAAYYGWRAKQQAGQANDAVNHTGPDDLRLYDLVSETHSRVRELESRHQVVTDIILTRPCMLTALACPEAGLANQDEHDPDTTESTL